MAIRETDTGVTYDNLFGGTEIPVMTKNISVAKNGALKRGSLLTEEGALVAANSVAAYVLAKDVDTTEAAVVATVYTSGRFNREALIVADGDTVAAHEAELRKVDIILTSVK